MGDENKENETEKLKNLEEKVNVLSKKILELERRVDAKLKENEKKLNEKTDKMMRKEVILLIGMHLKTIDDLKRILKLINTNIIVLGILITILYIFLIIAILMVI